MNKLNKGRSSVYSLRYHFITVVKYRRKIFVNEETCSFLKETVDQVAKEYDVEVISQECGEDHIHVLFSCKPTLIFKDFIQALKGRTARALRARFPSLVNEKLWGDHLWSPSYFLATVGNVSLDTLINYINTQRKESVDNEEEQGVQVQDIPESESTDSD